MKDLADLRFRRKFDRLLLIEMLGPLDIYKVWHLCSMLHGFGKLFFCFEVFSGTWHSKVKKE